jgi:hypothetical protein
MKDMFSGNDIRRPAANRRRVLIPGRWLPVLAVLLLPLLLGAWRLDIGDTINPRYVQHIQDGQTTRDQVLAWFGEPKKIERTEVGPVYRYFSYKDAPAMPYKPGERKINPQSDQPLVLGADKQIKQAPLKMKGKILQSTLTIRFKSDGQTVLGHEYKKY